MYAQREKHKKDQNRSVANCLSLRRKDKSLGVNCSNLCQMSTKIQHSGRNWTISNPLAGGVGPAGNRTVGHEMYAELDARDGRHGSETPGAGTESYQAMRDAHTSHPPAAGVLGAPYWVQGHLLNHDLGGVGQSTNLVPITTRANKLHYDFIEGYVKQSLYGNNVHPGAGAIGALPNNQNAYHVKYQVKAVKHGGGNLSGDSPHLRLVVRAERARTWSGVGGVPGVGGAPVDFDSPVEGSIESAPRQDLAGIVVPGAWARSAVGGLAGGGRSVVPKNPVIGGNIPAVPGWTAALQAAIQVAANWPANMDYATVLNNDEVISWSRDLPG